MTVPTSAILDPPTIIRGRPGSPAFAEMLADARRRAEAWDAAHAVDIPPKAKGCNNGPGSCPQRRRGDHRTIMVNGKVYPSPNAASAATGISAYILETLAEGRWLRPFTLRKHFAGGVVPKVKWAKS